MIAEKDGKLTVICPICSIDAVLGDASVRISATLLEAMHQYFFKTLDFPSHHLSSKNSLSDAS